MNSTPTKQFDANRRMGACERSVRLGYLEAIRKSSTNDRKIDLSIDSPSPKIFVSGPISIQDALEMALQISSEGFGDSSNDKAPLRRTFMPPKA